MVVVACNVLKMIQGVCKCFSLETGGKVILDAIWAVLAPPSLF